jgi:hypothetical protein
MNCSNERSHFSARRAIFLLSGSYSSIQSTKGYGFYTSLHRPCKTLIMNKLLGSSCKGQQFSMWIKTKTG